MTKRKTKQYQTNKKENSKRKTKQNKTIQKKGEITGDKLKKKK